MKRTRQEPILYRQEKTATLSFLEQLSKDHELIAPVKDDVVRFGHIDDVDAIVLDTPAFFPVKEFFFPQEEVLFTFKGNTLKLPQINVGKRIFFGLRRCDLNGIKHQDTALLGKIQDPYYLARRKDSLLIGYHCDEAPLKYCFCGSLELTDFFDLMYYERKDHYLVEIGSEKGADIIRAHINFFAQAKEKLSAKDKKIKGADKLSTTQIQPLYARSTWEKGISMCLSCSACTALCPTCYCFEIHDTMTMQDVHCGERHRSWSSCQLLSFTRVAGNHVFRDDRSERFKHRIYHQLVYFKERFGTTLCVGCGRCIEGCPTRIDFVGLINEMHHGQ